MARLALEKKAGDVVVIEVKRLSSVCDYVLICGGDSERQVKAIADSIEQGLKERGIRPFGVEGAEAGRWALLDYIDVVAHVFLTPVRGYYDLEGLWADAPRIELDEALPGRRARGAGRAAK